MRTVYRTPEQRPIDEDVVELLTKSLHVDESEKSLESDYTIIEGEASSITLTPRPNFTREEPLNLVQWTSFLDAEGRITNADAVKYAVFKGVSCARKRQRKGGTLITCTCVN